MNKSPKIKKAVLYPTSSYRTEPSTGPMIDPNAKAAVFIEDILFLIVSPKGEVLI